MNNSGWKIEWDNPEWTLILPDYWWNFYLMNDKITKILDETQWNPYSSHVLITVRCPSGWRSTPGKRVCGKLHRGFESPSHRHFTCQITSFLSKIIAKTAYYHFSICRFCSWMFVFVVVFNSPYNSLVLWGFWGSGWRINLFYEIMGDKMAVIAGNGGEVFTQAHATCHIAHHPRTDDRIHPIKIR